MRLLKDDLALAREFVADAETREGSLTRAFVAHAIAEINRAAPDEGRVLTKRLLTGGDLSLAASAASAIGSFQSPQAAEIDLAERALSSPHERIASRAIWVLRSWSSLDTPVLVGLAKQVYFGNSHHLADQVFSALHVIGKKVAFTLTAIQPTSSIALQWQIIPASGRARRPLGSKAHFSSGAAFGRSDRHRARSPFSVGARP